MARFKTLTHLFHLLLLLALAGCKSSEFPPPEATPEQVVREKAFLRGKFLGHPCFVAALERAKIRGKNLLVLIHIAQAAIKSEVIPV